MNTLFAALGGLCSKYLLQEKILVAPSFAAGRQIIRALALEGYPSINLKAETVKSLALGACRQALNQRELINETAAAYMIGEILPRLSARGKLAYFNALGITPGLSDAMYTALNELRQAGLTAAGIKTSAFVRESKGSDIITVLEEYLKELEKQGYIDEAGVYLLASRQGAVKPAAVYIIPENLQVTPVQRMFLQSLTENRHETIGLTQVKGLERPQNFFAAKDIGGEEVPPSQNQALGLLYDLHRQGDYGCKVELFAAYGESNEAREVIRRIKHCQFDQVTVIYTAQEPYVQLFYDLAQKLSLPISFGDGVAISNTRPGKLLRELVEWLECRCDVAVLYRILTGDNFAVSGDDSPDLLQAANLLRSAGIGWGRDRYSTVLDELASSLAQDDRASTESKNLLDWTRNLVQEIFSHIPEVHAQKTVDFPGLLRGLAEFTVKYALVKNALDEEARQSITDTLKGVASVAGGYLPLDQALADISRSVHRLRVGNSGPKPGTIHLCGINSGIYPNRPYNYVLGLDAARFPGQVLEDPVLLDVEKEKLGISPAKERPKGRLYTMVQLLADLPGKITLSYPAFDPVENRAGFPSALLLQVYRFLSKDPAKDYSDLLVYLGGKKGFVPEAGDTLDEGEVWLERRFKGPGVKDGLDTAKSIYPGLRDGLTAQDSRLASSFSGYDGKIQVESALLDPRNNPAIKLSCSQLENLAKCPFGYYLRYLLRVEPPQETGFDPGVWLEPKDRGSLLHEIFELFYRQFLPAGEKAAVERHEQALYKLAQTVLHRAKKEIPPPSDVVFEYEAQEILESCRLFLASEEHTSGTPTYFELSFGLGEESNGLGVLPAAEILLPGGSVVRLRGRIDRVDLEPDGTFTILDYKTGGTYLYKQNQPYRNGRLLQHALYALALEKVLKAQGIHPEPNVGKAGYIFPSLKGEGERVVYEQVNRRPVYEILENLFGILTTGSFGMTDDLQSCRYCDYTPVCEPGLYLGAVKEMLEEPGNRELEFFRRLKTYA